MLKISGWNRKEADGKEIEYAVEKVQGDDEWIVSVFEYVPKSHASKTTDRKYRSVDAALRRFYQLIGDYVYHH